MHQKGHQNAKGKIIATGRFRSTFLYEVYRDTWIWEIKESLEDLQQQLQLSRDRTQPGTEDDTFVLQQHSLTMTRFYRKTTLIDKFRNHSFCVCCFTQISTYAIPCGHVLCTACIQGYGSTSNKIDFGLDCCPLHPDETRTQWRRPCTIRFKPHFAGVRLLSLDG
jgi:hypothetical protein